MKDIQVRDKNTDALGARSKEGIVLNPQGE